MASSNSVKKSKVIRRVFDWNIQTTKLLINLYEENENLYNTLHPDYKDRNLRLKTLIKISELITEATQNVCLVQDVRRKINSLRSQYLTEKLKISKSKTESDDGDCYTPTVYWYPMLQFLDGAGSADHTKPNLTLDDSENSNHMETQDTKLNIVNTKRQKKRKLEKINDDSEFNDVTPDDTDKFSYISNLTSSSTSNSNNIDAFCRFVAAELNSILEASSMFYVKKAKRSIQQLLFKVWDEIDGDPSAIEQNSLLDYSREAKPVILRNKVNKLIKRNSSISPKASIPEQIYLQSWNSDED